MLLFGIVFEEERSTFADLAFHIYEQVTSGKVAIQNYRFVSVITQWIPTQLFSAGVEMKSVQLVYSIVFPVFYGAVWAFTHFVLKAKQWALAWALLWLTFATHTLFWIQSELPQGLAVLVIALGLLSYRTEKNWTPFVVKTALAILLVTVAFAHPLLITVVTFSFGLLWFLKPQSKRIIKLSAALYYFSFLVKAIIFRTPYDKSAGGGIKIGLTTLANFEIPYSIPHLFQNLTTTYYALFIIALLGIWWLWKSENHRSAKWTLAAIVGHFGIVSIVHSTSATPDFYFENLCLPAAFIATAGFAFGIQQAKLKAVSKTVSVVLVLFMIIRLGHVAWIGDNMYATRLEFLKEMIYRHAHEKVIYKETPELRDSLIITWGTSYEAWILSARNQEPTHCFLVSEDPAELQWAIDDPNHLILNFHQPLFSELPKGYFKQPDDKLKYRIIH